MKHRKLHMIGNAHIDPVWLWQWQEGFHEVRASFRSALDRMNEYDDFQFVASSAAFYEWIEQIDPAMFEEIRARVAEGRWQIIGGWWIEPDCNIPSGESFARQVLYGQRYFQQKFGVIAKIGFNPDSFGHHAMLPQILKKGGLDYYVFQRPGPQEKSLPGRLFWWEADDGSRVLAFRIPFEYCTWGKDIEKHVRRVANEMKAPVDELLCFYGVGNHGGGPTIENIESIRRLNDDPTLPELTLSNPEAYFESIARKGWSLPIVHDELQHHASGCYAAHGSVKRWNRQAEHLLLAAEKFSAVANRVAGLPYPADLERAWKNVLFNQFHDIMAGTSLEAAYEDARNQYGEALAIADRALTHATQAIAWKVCIDPEPGMKPITVFNPNGWRSRINVGVEWGRLADDFTLLDEENHEVPAQLVQSQALASRSRLSFMADLPPLGYRTYRLVPRPHDNGVGPMESSDTVLESSRFRLEFDPTTGTIKSLRDKQHNTEVFKGEAARAVVIDDHSDTWSHNVFRFDQVCGAFTPSSVKLVEHGPVKSVIRVTSAYNASTLVQDFTVYRALDQIDVHVTVDWREQFKALKLRFPINVHFHKVTSEIPYGHIERFANGQEEPGQSWVDVSGSSIDTGDLYGVSILNDGKYSLDVNVRDIGLTVLRSPIYAHHIPSAPQPDGHYSFMDHGIQHFTYTIYPHEGGWEQAHTVQRATELNQRPIAVIGTYHNGPLPQTDSYLNVDQDNIVISAIKKAEDNDDLIVRCYETTKTATHATIWLLDRMVEAAFGPCEIKTFRVAKDTTQPIIETNLLESALTTGDFDAVSGETKDRIHRR